LVMLGPQGLLRTDGKVAVHNRFSKARVTKLFQGKQ
jgi:hypothetical protein